MTAHACVQVSEADCSHHTICRVQVHVYSRGREEQHEDDLRTPH